MTYETYLNQAWDGHVDQSEKLAQEFEQNLSLLETPEQLISFSHLVTHVFGEHLGQWQSGANFLRSLQRLEIASDRQTHDQLKRCIATLEYANESRKSLDEFSNSDQIRILCVATSALEANGNRPRAFLAFRHALKQSESLSLEKDPAHRALAIAGNNLACALEESSSRNEEETHFMILAAQTSLKFWIIAGSSAQIAQAHYRVSQSYLQAGQPLLSLENAQQCLALCKAHNGSEFDFFYGFEAMALAQRALGREREFQEAFDELENCFAKLSKEEKTNCLLALEKLQTIVKDFKNKRSDLVV